MNKEKFYEIGEKVFKEIGLQNFYEEENLKFMNLTYCDSILHIYGTKQDGKIIHKEYECTPEIVAILFLELINVPMFITANKETPCNVAVEYEEFR